MPEGIHTPEKPTFEELYETYYDRVYRYAYTILLNRENAEDMTEETFMAAYMAYARYDPARASPATWLTRIAHNKAVNLVRSADYRHKAEMPEPEEFRDEDPEDFTESVEAREVVLWLFSHLKEEEREFLNLRYVMELRDAEIAEMMGLQVKTVNKRFQRLLKRCREIIKNVR